MARSDERDNHFQDIPPPVAGHRNLPARFRACLWYRNVEGETEGLNSGRVPPRSAYGRHAFLERFLALSLNSATTAWMSDREKYFGSYSHMRNPQM
jgi:hypothetical protein